jgi:hypothetical protein
MDKLKRLQKQYAAGKLTDAQYKAALADLLDDEEVTQEEHDEALDFEPEDDGGKPIYTQADVDGFVVKKARALVKKALRDAGVDVSDVKQQEIIAKAAELAAAGVGKSTAGDEELKALRKKAAAYDEVAPTVNDLKVENAVLKTAQKYNPINPAQVVRAIKSDYADLLEYDDESGALDIKSVHKAMKRITEVEPNLFNTAGAGSEEDEDLEDKGTDFSGKPPGNAGGASSKSQKEAAKLAADKAAALAMMGLSTNKQ